GPRAVVALPRRGGAHRGIHGTRIPALGFRQQRSYRPHLPCDHPPGGARQGVRLDPASVRGVGAAEVGMSGRTADHEYGFRTRAIHAGNIPDAATGSRALPIYQSSAFVFDSTDDAAARFALQKYGNVYSRLSNPTVASFEERIASL